jgi:hypothetical protein
MSCIRLLLSFMLMLLVGGATALNAEDAGGDKHKGGGVRGTITAVDATAKTVTIKGEGDKTTTYTTTADTKVSIDRAPATLADLKVGDTAFVKADGTVASRIGVRHGEEKKKDEPAK